MSLAAQAFDLQGHRGARGLAPENTLPGFARALSIGVTTLELDVGVTRDGVVVISHERRLHPNTARGPDGKWLEGPGPTLHSLTYAELERYDVGRLNPARDYAHQFPAQVPADGARIPRLADLFALVRKARNDAVRFNIETKISPEAPNETLPPAELARALIAAIRAGGMASRATIQSFDWRSLKIVQAEAPEIPTVYLSAQQHWLDNIRAGDSAGSAWTAGVQLARYGSVPAMVKTAGGAIWSPYFGDLDAAKLGEAHALGLKVIPWTVSQPAQIEALLTLGVDGLISDRPDLVREAMRRKGMPLPAPTPVAMKHALRLALGVVAGSGWSPHAALEAARGAAAILAQCGIRTERIDLRELDVPERYRHFSTPASRELARRAGLAKPAIFFVADTRQEPAFEAEAVGLANSRSRPDMANTVWVTAGAHDLPVTIAHELAHVLADSGAHSDAPGNLMRDETAPQNVRLSDAQCRAMLETGAANGLLRAF